MKKHQTESKKILLFISKNSTYFWSDLDNFKKLIITLSNKPAFKTEVIDIVDHPELAEKYKIEALPTLVIDGKKYIGKPSPEKAIEIFEQNNL